MRVSTPSLFSQGILGIRNLQDTIAELAKQQGGKRVIDPSDAPSDYVQAESLSLMNDRIDRYSANISLAKSSLGIQDSLLGSATSLLQTIRDLAVSSNMPHLGFTDRQAILQQAQSKLSELLDLANTKDHDGNFLFSGYEGGVTPFLKQSDNTVIYQADHGQRSVYFSQTRQVAISDSGFSVFMNYKNGNGNFVTANGGANTGSGFISAGTVFDSTQYLNANYSIQITGAGTAQATRTNPPYAPGAPVVTAVTFTPGAPIHLDGMEFTLSGTAATGDTFTLEPATPQGVFSTIQRFLNILNAPVQSDPAKGNYQTEIGRVLSELDLGIEHISSVRANVGARMNLADSASSLLSNSHLQNQKSIEDMTGVDLTDLVSKIAANKLHLDVAEKIFASLQNSSLFDFL